jgi:hypothetical protein
LCFHDGSASSSVKIKNVANDVGVARYGLAAKLDNLECHYGFFEDFYCICAELLSAEYDRLF